MFSYSGAFKGPARMVWMECAPDHHLCV